MSGRGWPARAAEVFALVQQIPPGQVVSYGTLGQLLNPPLSGYFVGRIMNSCPDDVPWWRVVGRTGQLPVWKKDPRAQLVQAARLVAEGVAFTEDMHVRAVHFLHEDDWPFPGSSE